MRKNFLFVMLALVSIVLFSCKKDNGEQEGSKFVISVTSSDITGSTAKVSASATDSTRFTVIVLKNSEWTQVKQTYPEVTQQNKALVAAFKEKEVLLEEDFVKDYCYSGSMSKVFTKLVANTEYAAVAFTYLKDGECGSENFVNTFTTADVAPLTFEQVSIGAYSATFDVVPQDTTKFFYIKLYEKGYVEEFLGYGYTEYDLNESEVGKLEYAYEYTYGSEATPYQLATTYMYKGTTRVTFTGLSKNSEYTMIGFFYDYDTDKADSALYRLDFKTENGGGGKVYPVDMTIDLKWSNTTLTATPSILTQTYLFDALPGSQADNYSTVDDLAEAVLESYGGKIASNYLSTGVDSYDFSGLCYYYSDETEIVGFAFGVGTDGKICSQPVMVKMTNPYYSSSSSSYDLAPSRKMANKKMLGGK